MNPPQYLSWRVTTLTGGSKSEIHMFSPRYISGAEKSRTPQYLWDMSQKTQICIGTVTVHKDFLQGFFFVCLKGGCRWGGFRGGGETHDCEFVLERVPWLIDMGLVNVTHVGDMTHSHESEFVRECVLLRIHIWLTHRHTCDSLTDTCDSLTDTHVRECVLLRIHIWLTHRHTCVTWLIYMWLTQLANMRGKHAWHDSLVRDTFIHM